MKTRLNVIYVEIYYSREAERERERKKIDEEGGKNANSSLSSFRSFASRFIVKLLPLPRPNLCG